MKNEFQDAQDELKKAQDHRDDLDRQHSEAVSELERAAADRAGLVDKVSSGGKVPDADLRKAEERASAAQNRMGLIAEAQRRADGTVLQWESTIASLQKALVQLDHVADKLARVSAGERVDAAAKEYCEAIVAWQDAGQKVIASLPPHDMQTYITPLTDPRPAVAILPMPIQQAAAQNAFRLLTSVADLDRGLWPRLSIEALDLEHRRALLVNSTPDEEIPAEIVT